MASAITNITSARAALARMKGQVAAMKAGSQEVIGEGIAFGEVLLGAAAMGFADEKWGKDRGDGIKELTIRGEAPVSLVASGFGKLAAFLGFGGELSEHAHSLMNGVGAGWSYNIGRAAAKASSK